MKYINSHSHLVFTATRLDKLSHTHLYLLFLIFLLLIFPASLLLGALLPPLEESQKQNVYLSEFTDENLHWIGKLHHLHPLNDQFALQATFSHYKENGFSRKINMNMIVSGYDQKQQPIHLYNVVDYSFYINCLSNTNTEYCVPITLLQESATSFTDYKIILSMNNIITHDSFNTKDNIEFKFVWINSSFVISQLVLKYLFSVISITCFIWLYVSQSRYADINITAREHSMQYLSYWSLIILFGLILFNDPLFAFRLLFKNWLFPAISLICQASFFSLLLLFLMFRTQQFIVHFQSLSPHNDDMINYSNSLSKTNCCEKICYNPACDIMSTDWPKLLMVGLFWLTCCIIAIISTIHEFHDPFYHLSEGTSGAFLYCLSTLLFLIVSLMWIGYLYLRAWEEMKKLDKPNLTSLHIIDSQYIALKRRFYFLSSTTIFSLLCLIIILVFQIYSGDFYANHALPQFVGNLLVHDTGTYIFFNILYNCYVLIFVYCDLPYYGYYSNI